LACCGLPKISSTRSEELRRATRRRAVRKHCAWTAERRLKAGPVKRLDHERVNFHSHRLPQKFDGDNEPKLVFLAHKDPLDSFERPRLDPDPIPTFQKRMGFNVESALNKLPHRVNLDIRNGTWSV